MTDSLSSAREALGQYEAILGVPLTSSVSREERIKPIAGGLINETFLVEIPAKHGTARAVLQRVNPLFGIDVHKDIFAVTQHLSQKNLVTPVLLPTRTGDLAVHLGKQGVWRLLTYIDGVSFSHMTPKIAFPAGELVGSFHAAVADLDHSFHFVRKGAHDFPKHLQNLILAVDKARNEHPGAVPSEFGSVADSILHFAAQIPVETPGKLRVCHGDLKVNNLRFDQQGRGICLLDLDTLARLPLAFELGDALRSYCNPRGEDVSETQFDCTLLEAVLRGYSTSAKSFITDEEVDFLITGTLRISIQLAARFAADVVNQNYFRYDPSRFPSRAIHNLIRAKGQLSLAQSLLSQQLLAETLVRSCFNAG
ncbi:MAG TPA: aminoglycoside phosphotransferase family protein [Pseudomonadota bacterium]|nr:aminoglycoside phosphotransferase family protein [Pseudomonadota bacterium]